MVKSYKLDKLFGPAGSFAGIVLFCVGLGMTIITYSGLFLVFFGAFIGFTYTSTLIDFDKRRVKFSENLFGIYRFGKWMDIEPGMTIGVIESNMFWRSFSRSNRSINTLIKDSRLILYDANHREIMPILKVPTREAAILELEKMESMLGMNPA